MQVSKARKDYKLVDAGFGKKVEIPEEWEVSKLEDIFSLKQGKYFDEDLVKEGKFAVYGANGIISRCNEYMHTDRTVLVSCRGANCGVVHFTEKFSWVNNNSIAMIPQKDIIIHPHFFYYFLSNMTFQDVISGSAQPQIIVSHLNKKIIFLPKFKEQQGITSILSNVDNALEKTNQLIEETELLKKGLMQKLLTKGIRHTKFKKIQIRGIEKSIEIPNTWKIVKVGEISKVIDPNPSHRSPKIQSDGIPFLSIKDLNKNGDIINITRRVNLDALKKQEKILKIQDGDIGIGRVGSIGKVVKLQNQNAALSTRIIVVKLNEDFSDYIFEFFNSELFQTQLSFYSSGSTFSMMGIKLIRELSIPLPPISEQKQIAEILSNIDSQINEEKLNKKNLELLKKGLMQKLLTGQIRVRA